MLCEGDCLTCNYSHSPFPTSPCTAEQKPHIILTRPPWIRLVLPDDAGSNWDLRSLEAMSAPWTMYGCLCDPLTGFLLCDSCSLHCPNEAMRTCWLHWFFSLLLPSKHTWYACVLALELPHLALCYLSLY